MRKQFMLLLFLGSCLLTFGQAQQKYDEFIAKAEEFYKEKQYKESSQNYKWAFEQFEGKAYPSDRYNAACSYSLSQNLDTAFYHLFRLANDSKYKDYDRLTNDKDLQPLYKDERWKQLKSKVKENKEIAEANLDRPLAATLDSIYEIDQGLRGELENIEKEFGRNSKEMKMQWKKISDADNSNVKVVAKILDERGWLGADIVGDKGNQTLFLVIQHADIEIQEKYIPMFRDAVKKGNGRASSLALMEDRVALRRGGKQIYGSQVFTDNKTEEMYFGPIEDPENVDTRRAEVGLQPLNDYAALFGFSWNLEAHKKRHKMD